MDRNHRSACRNRWSASSEYAPDRRGRILLINAVNEIARERAQSFLQPEHQKRILTTYRAFADEPGFAKVVSIKEVIAKDANLSISLHLPPTSAQTAPKYVSKLETLWEEFAVDDQVFWSQMEAITEMFDATLTREVVDA